MKTCNALHMRPFNQDGGNLIVDFNALLELEYFASASCITCLTLHMTHHSMMIYHDVIYNCGVQDDPESDTSS